MLVPQGDRVVHVGHDGAMPGFLAGAYGRRAAPARPAAMGCAVLGSSGTAVEMLELPHPLLAAAVEDDPADIEPWAPGRAGAAGSTARALGRWWGEGFEYVFSWHDGAPAGPRRGRPARAAAGGLRARPTSRTSCAPSPAGRPASCCG